MIARFHDSSAGRLPDQVPFSSILNTLYEKQFSVLSVKCLEIG
jgi:hypothetical protein